VLDHLDCSIVVLSEDVVNGGGTEDYRKFVNGGEEIGRLGRSSDLGWSQWTGSRQEKFGGAEAEHFIV